MKGDKIHTFLAASTVVRFRLALDHKYEEEVKAYLGERAFQEYVILAQEVVQVLDQRHLSIHAPTNLIFVPGVMGSLLESPTLGGVWWIDLFNLGRLDDLKLSPDGQEDASPDYRITAFNIHTIYTAFLAAVLKRDDFGHVLFPYDWRKPITWSTRAFRDKILATYNTNGHIPVHLVAHSMGGLVVRATLMEYGEELWPKLGRIVFIGTPHYGSPAIGGYLKNHLWGFDSMILLGRFISRTTFRSLWGVLSMLPAPQGIYPGTREELFSPVNAESLEEAQGTYDHPCANFDMYQADSWKLSLSTVEISQLQCILDGAAEFHQRMYQYHQDLDQDLRDRMAVIAGVGYQTLFRLAYRSDIPGLWKHMRKVKARLSENPHREGDGSVPLASASLENVGATCYVKGIHKKLPMMPEVYEDVFHWLNDQYMELPITPRAALSTHLSGEPDLHETPLIDSLVRPGAIHDDPGYWDIEEPDSAYIANLEAKLAAGQIPEFINVSLL